MSELTLQAACNESRKFGRMITSLAKLQEVADAFEGAGQLIAERERQAAELLAKAAALRTEIETAVAEVAQIREAAAKIPADAQAEAEGIIATAREAAAKTVSEANAELERIRGEAHSLSVRADAARQTLDAAEKEHANISSRISEAQAKARAIIGAE